MVIIEFVLICLTLQLEKFFIKKQENRKTMNQEKEAEKEVKVLINKTLYDLIKEYNKKKKFKESERLNSFKEISEKLKKELETKDIHLDFYECFDATIESFKWFEDNFKVMGTKYKTLIDTAGIKIPAKFTGKVISKTRVKSKRHKYTYITDFVTHYIEGKECSKEEFNNKIYF